MKIILALFFIGFVVAEHQVHGGSFDAQAYPVKWSPRGEDSSYAAPPPPPLSLAGGPFDAEAYPVKWSPRADDSSFYAPPPHPGVDVEAPTVHNEHHIMVKTGVLFLKRNLFDGAVLPANTKLGHVDTQPSSPSTPVSATGPAPPQFAFSNLGDILTFYNIARGSERARQTAATLHFCRDLQQKEPHVCAATQRAAMKFAEAALGKPPRAERTIVHGRGEEPLRYVVAPNGVASIGGGGKVVPCHPLPYPAEVLYCHQPGGVQALRVELIGQDDPSLGATAIAVCHEETGGWDPEYFAMLNGTRGEPVCHYMPEKYILWV